MQGREQTRCVVLPDSDVWLAGTDGPQGVTRTKNTACVCTRHYDFQEHRWLVIRSVAIGGDGHCTDFWSRLVRIEGRNFIEGDDNFSLLLSYPIIHKRTLSPRSVLAITNISM